MGTWSEHSWAPSENAPNRRDRRAGAYCTYRPDLLMSRSFTLTPALHRRTAEVEDAVRALVAHDSSAALEGLARLLLRSEAIASSQIEGLQVGPQNVALVEFARDEGLTDTSFTRNAQLVANNVVALRDATATAVRQPLSLHVVDDLHRALLPDHQPPGLRTVQNWLGGSSWHPLDAEFVPPPPELVRPLVEDLVSYAAGGLHAPLVQAGIVHAQFETIHPYTDGNGRVGRALVHAVLVRRGLARTATLPISMVLLTRSQDYVDALTAFRHGPDDDGSAAAEQWLALFLDATEAAVDIARGFAAAVDLLRNDWTDQVGRSRADRGLRPDPRRGSATSRLLATLPETPVLTARSVQRSLDVSHQAARAALDELATARVLATRQVARGTTGYLATDVFALLTTTERRLASTRFDTRASAPVRPVPALPR